MVWICLDYMDYIWVIGDFLVNIPKDDAEQPWGKPGNMIDGGVST